MTERLNWQPQGRRYQGRVFRYVPHYASERDGAGAATDGTYARQDGGRWNPPGSFRALYTSCTEAVAIANLRYKYRGKPFQPWELDEADQADLYTLDVDQDRLADATSEAGLAGLGLPSTYPDDIGHDITQPIGARLYSESYAGVWCRSAADRTGEEIALFLDENHAVTPNVADGPRRFWEWFPIPDEWKPVLE